MHSYTSEAVIAAKILRNPGGQCTSVLANTLEKQAFCTVFDPPQRRCGVAASMGNTPGASCWPRIPVKERSPRAVKVKRHLPSVRATSGVQRPVGAAPSPAASLSARAAGPAVEGELSVEGELYESCHFTARIPVPVRSVPYHACR